jgi:hypothetical protein
MGRWAVPVRNTMLVWVAAATLPAFASAHAAGGRCDLNTKKVSGTYGFAAQGVATGKNPFAPIGPFAQSGTVTSTATTEGDATIRGRWSATLAQNDASGYKPEVTFGGTFVIDKRTCAGDYFVKLGSGKPVLGFHVIEVGGGEEVRAISAIPGLVIAYVSAKRL